MNCQCHPLLSSSSYDGSHTFWPVSSYICSLPYGCFESVEEEATKDGIIENDDPSLSLNIARYLILKASSLSCIEEFLKSSNGIPVIEVEDDERECNNDNAKLAKTSVKDNWVTQGSIVLQLKDKQEVLRGKELNDLQINAFQNLLKTECKHVDGLMDTLLLKKAFQFREGKIMLQVIHIRSSHWAALQVYGNNVCVYDSSYTSLSKDTLAIVAKLVCCQQRELHIKLMNTAKQIGSADCGLFALATITSLALGSDPLMVIYDQDELRLHYIRTLESGEVTTFPILKKRRPATQYKLETCNVYCICRLPDHGGQMIGCDGCDEWFHSECLPDVSAVLNKEGKWLCQKCIR